MTKRFKAKGEKRLVELYKRALEFAAKWFFALSAVNYADLAYGFVAFCTVLCRSAQVEGRDESVDAVREVTVTSLASFAAVFDPRMPQKN